MPAKPKPTSLLETVKQGSRRDSLIAIRDAIAHELEANLCNTCLNSRLRTGDQAALYLRLTKVMEDIENMPEEEGGIDELERLRQRRDGSSVAENPEHSPQAVKRRQGGRRPSGTRRLES